MKNLVLEMTRPGGHYSANALLNQRNEIGERLACAGAGLRDQGATVGQDPTDFRCHFLLRSPRCEATDALLEGTSIPECGGRLDHFCARQRVKASRQWGNSKTKTRDSLLFDNTE